MIESKDADVMYHAIVRAHIGRAFQPLALCALVIVNKA
jgi:hypothetical protein